MRRMMYRVASQEGESFIDAELRASTTDGRRWTFSDGFGVVYSRNNVSAIATVLVENGGALPRLRQAVPIDNWERLHAS